MIAVLNILLLFGAQAVRVDAVPTVLAAKAPGCDGVPIADGGIGCFVHFAIGSDDYVAAYKHERDGQYKLVESLCLPHQSRGSKLSTVRMFEAGIGIASVEFDGNTGTGQAQRVLMLLQMTPDGLRPLLLETVDYTTKSECIDESLAGTVKYQALRSKAPRVQISWKHRLRRCEKGYSSNSEWKEDLVWNATTSTFYTREVESAIAGDAQLGIPGNVARFRLYVIDHSSMNLCDETWRTKSGLFQILGRSDATGSR